MGVINSRLVFCTLAILLMTCHVSLVFAQSPAAAPLKLLKSGRVPAERLPAVIKSICDRGNADDLAQILAEIVQPMHWSDAAREAGLAGLRTAASDRKVIPSGDLAVLTALLSVENQEVHKLTIDLLGLWKVEAALPELTQIAEDKTQTTFRRESAMRAIALINPETGSELLVRLAESDEPFAIRATSISILARLNPTDAAQRAVHLLKQLQAGDNPSGLLGAFLDLNQGSKVLAEQLAASPVEQDVAKRVLRQMYRMGRTDAELNQILSAQAGMNSELAPPTPEEVAALVLKATQHGNAARGEEIYRRADLSCTKCHALSKAGGQIGPDLSAIGVSSPVDYLVTSILDPDQAIKEAFITKTVFTEDGQILSGIVADRTRDTLVLKDAQGKLITVPLSDIEDEVEGKSLMPKGLVNFLTEDELLDLVAFLSELGKPGEYEIRSTPRLQRYQVLESVADSLTAAEPDQATFEKDVIGSDAWSSVYAKVNGTLPLTELAERLNSRVFYVLGEVSCTKAGPATLHINNDAGVTLWIDDEKLSPGTEVPIELTEGTHKIVIRIDLDQRQDLGLKLELGRPASSSAEFQVVDGQ
ncbi:hypothetical protein SH668x_002319 [Planctomicrobium sp. SH668]|uniref:hypothetical protein n=1 Tax=Planctomicrobium sp. SH668 TaxID=3448126 RepID=UPI003F5C5594